MRSQVQKGTRNVGYVTTSAQRLSERPSRATTVLSGRNRSDGGTRYVMKMAMPKESPPGNLRRASGEAASTPRNTEMKVGARLTNRLVTDQLQNNVALQ